MLTTDLAKGITSVKNMLLSLSFISKDRNNCLRFFTYVGTITVRREEQLEKALFDITTSDVDKVRSTRALFAKRQSNRKTVN